MTASVRCVWCGMEIEACDGRYGWWMHSRSRSEKCLSGWPPRWNVAEPEPGEVVGSRLSASRRRQARTNV